MPLTTALPSTVVLIFIEKVRIGLQAIQRRSFQRVRVSAPSERGEDSVINSLCAVLSAAYFRRCGSLAYEMIRIKISPTLQSLVERKAPPRQAI